VLEPKPTRSPASGPRRVDVRTETETDSGWSYQVAVGSPEDHMGIGAPVHTVTISWADHDHLSGGAAQPSEVVRRVIELMLEDDRGRTLPARFDVSTARRLVPNLEERLRLGGG